MAKVHQLRPADNEKITINLGHVDLGRIDLLVRDGFYSNRTDFIRTAIRNQLTAQQEQVSRSVKRQRLEVGLLDLTRDDLEAARAENEKLDIRVVGLARIAADVPADLALATIGSIHVLGALQAPSAVKAALKDRII
ncbi:CopG family transcriptional regulator [Sulfitobacter sp. D35]|uniref:CopG family transcriptional regulator n=1 Tax=Sulfitobacter sp. D35 TaxID=3083252 RepID=UPI00296FE305|nr:CopG family transcriptional regulator [Sulfitobacter sp. D35]MDW4497148.1 CopG family transcriptional regulator [Sulfitobacter sp. D35]